MGLSHAELKLTNLFKDRTVQIKALVDTGAIFLCVTEQIARDLGFDVDEVIRTRVQLADGSTREVPRIGPLRIEFGNRDCAMEALVLGNEPLMGVLPIEAMDLIVDPRSQRLMVNPDHPDVPVFHAKTIKP